MAAVRDWIDIGSDFDDRVASHDRDEAEHNRWHTDEMATNVAALHDSKLSADFNYYRDLSNYFTGALLRYEITKKCWEFSADADTFFPWWWGSWKHESRFSRIHSMTNGEILDILDNCVKELDARYNLLMQQRKSNQR